MRSNFLTKGKTFFHSRAEYNVQLNRAAYYGQLRDVQLLVTPRNINGACSNGATPLQIAAQQGNLDVVRYLVKSKANIDQPRTAGVAAGATPLHMAAGMGHLDVVRFLVQSKANVNQTRMDGVTPLMYAAHHGHYDIVKLLVQSGANVHATTAGWTALQMAQQNRHYTIVAYLRNLSKGVTCANVDEKTCKICFEKDIDVVLVPCGHLCACRECALKITLKVTPSCPICLKNVDKVVAVYYT